MMKFSCLFFSFFLLVILFVNVQAADNESLGQQAEQAGNLRQALTHYVEALKADENNQQLREEIIRLAQKIQPLPVVPEEARKFSIRGQSAIKAATSTSDYKEAAVEFGKAVNVAPWWADAYFNLGVAHEKAKDFGQAISSFKFYLLAAPNAPDARDVQDQIYSLEYQLEKSQKKVEKKKVEEKKKKASLESLSGKWNASFLFEGLYQRPDLTPSRWAPLYGKVNVLVKKDSFSATFSSGGRIFSIYRGKIVGNRIQGEFIDLTGMGEDLCGKKPPPSPLEGEITQQKNIILLVVRGTQLGPGGNCRYDSERYSKSIRLDR